MLRYFLRRDIQKMTKLTLNNGKYSHSGVKNMSPTSAKENKKDGQSKSDKLLNNRWVWMLETLWFTVL